MTTVATSPSPTTARGEVALVTGASRGLGVGIARALGAAGLTVLVGARDPQRGARTVADLRTDGAHADLVPLDVTAADQVAAAAEDIDRRFGRLDVLVNNAGVLPEAVDGTVSPLRATTVRTTFETNVFGTVAVTEAMLPLLRRAPAGRIVTVSSSLGSLRRQDEAGRGAAPVVPAYQASKAALSSITIALAKLVAEDGVRVTAVCPGFVRTDIHPAENRARATSTPDEAGAFVARVALDVESPTGRFVDRDGTVPW